MTTNVYDSERGVMASDSRWSCRIVDGPMRTTSAVLYVDDTGFDKIAFHEDTSYMFAGPGHLIDLWRTWAISAHKDILKRPPVGTDFAVCMVDIPSGEIVIEHGQRISDSVGRFAGTGAKPAYECWSANKDPRKAVDSAKLADVLSGGAIKFLTRDRDHNIDFGVEFKSVNEQLIQKGMVMYATSSNAIPVAMAAQNDPRIKELVDKVQRGEAAAEAPSGLDPVIWTSTDEARLDAAILKRFGPKK